LSIHLYQKIQFSNNNNNNNLETIKIQKLFGSIINFGHGSSGIQQMVGAITHQRQKEFSLKFKQG